MILIFEAPSNGEGIVNNPFRSEEATAKLCEKFPSANFFFVTISTDI